LEQKKITAVFRQEKTTCFTVSPPSLNDLGNIVPKAIPVELQVRLQYESKTCSEGDIDDGRDLLPCCPFL